jgi:hypothetical protein
VKYMIGNEKVVKRRRLLSHTERYIEQYFDMLTMRIDRYKNKLLNFCSNIYLGTIKPERKYVRQKAAKKEIIIIGNIKDLLIACDDTRECEEEGVYAGSICGLESKSASRFTME